MPCFNSKLYLPTFVYGALDTTMYWTNHGFCFGEYFQIVILLTSVIYRPYLIDLAWLTKTKTKQNEHKNSQQHHATSHLPAHKAGHKFM